MEVGNSYNITWEGNEEPGGLSSIFISPAPPILKIPRARPKTFWALLQSSIEKKKKIKFSLKNI